jgi:hypothetical protein
MGISREAERRRRLLTRAVPIALIGAAAFIGGVVVAGGSPELDAAKRFVEAWEKGDLETMHAELNEAAAAEYPIGRFEELYGNAEMTATTSSIEAGEPEGPRASDDVDVVSVPVTARTKAFGDVSETVEIPVADGGVAWVPRR